METKTNYSASRRAWLFNASLCVSIALVLSAFEWNFAAKDVRMFSAADLFIGEEEIVIPHLLPPPPKKPVVVNPTIKEVKDDLPVEEVESDFSFEDQIDLPFLPDMDVPVTETPDEIMDYSEVMPEPIGGMSEWQQFLAKNLKYPKQALRAGTQGTVYASFIVNMDGSISDIAILRGIGMGCDEEAIRVLSIAPRWSPGRQRGKPVRVRMRVPIRFKLN